MAQGQTGGSSGTSSGTTRGGGSNQGQQDASELANKAREAARDAAGRASEALDDVYERGQRYYRQGSRAVSDVDGNTATALFAAGAVGFALAWLIFAQRSYSGDYVTRGMSRSSDRYS